MRAFLLSFFCCSVLTACGNPYAPPLPETVGIKGVLPPEVGELAPSVDDSRIYSGVYTWARRRCGVTVEHAEQSAEAAVAKARTQKCFVLYCTQKGGQPYGIISNGDDFSEGFNGWVCTSGTEKTTP